MKKLVVLALASLLIANVAFAVVDPDTNSMGVYFDLTADTYELAAGPYMSTPTYVMLTNPDFDALYGYEYTLTVEGNASILATVLAGTGPIDVGNDAGEHIVGLASPMAVTPATVITTLTVFNLDTNPIHFTLSGALPNSVIGSNTPALLLAGDVIVAAGTSSYMDGTPMVNAAINDAGAVVAVDEASWDQVKSLYR